MAAGNVARAGDSSVVATDLPARSGPPRLPERVVARQELAAKYAFGDRPVSLICAPAGYGKTTVAADWARRPEATGRVAWITLNEGHDDLFRFWTAIIRALASVSGSDTAQVLMRLRPPQQGPESGFAAALANVLDTIPDTRWLVLDDVHHLRSSTVLAELDRLLTSRAENLRFILIGRIDPTLSTAKLRVSGELCELRAAELAFSISESRSFLSIHSVNIDDTDLNELHQRTEGWPAGLRLAALSLIGADDRHAAVTSFAGDERAVSDYLFAEVLRQQPAEMRDFLLATCVPEDLSAELAQHLSGRADSGAVLERLSRANALVMQLGDRAWYRYHSMLRGYLAAAVLRLDPDMLARQHASAAAWFAAHGRHRMALGHAISGRDQQQIVEIIDAGGLNLLLSGAAELLLEAVAAVPEIADTPAVAALAASAAMSVGDLTNADKFLALDNPGNLDSDRATVLVNSARLDRALLGGDVPAALAASGLARCERTGETDLDLLVLVRRGPARMRSGAYGKAVEDLAAALDLARRAGYDEVALEMLSQLSGVTGSACDFTAMKDWSDEAIAFARPRGWANSPRLAYAYLLAAWTGFQTGDVAAQATYADRAIECLEPVTNVEVALGVRSMAALARFEASSGTERYQAAWEFRDLWLGPAAAQVSPALIGFATPQEVRLALSVGEYQWAAEAVTRVERQLPHSAESLTLHATVLTAQGRDREALQTLKPVLHDEVTVHVRTTVVTADLLAWLLHTRRGDVTLAHASLEHALTWAAPRNFKRPFLDSPPELWNTLAASIGRFGRADQFVSDLLAHRAQDPGSRTQPAAPAVMLTARELEVLHDLPSQLTLAEIAAARTISRNTVKTHLAGIYQKLGVTGRREAVLEARRIGLL